MLQVSRHCNVKAFLHDPVPSIQDPVRSGVTGEDIQANV
jgi:hypothetical protein